MTPEDRARVGPADNTATEYDEYACLTPLITRQSIHRTFSDPPDRMEDQVLETAGVSAQQDVLEVGPGNGSLLRRLADGGHRGRLVGLDRAPTAAESVAGIDGVTSLLGDACRLPFGAASFDSVLAVHVLYHVSDVVDALNEFKRVLRPGGKCVSVVNHAVQVPRIAEVLNACVSEYGITPPELPRINSDNLPGLHEPVFPNVSVTRFDGNLVFPQPAPVLALAIALLGLYGIAPTAAERPDAEARLAAEINSWFATSSEPWRDPKGFVICTATRED